MTLDSNDVDAALAAIPPALEPLKADWLRLMELAVWGDLASGRLGATGRLRKRLLEVGEGLAGLARPRDWIPHPRERLKSALGASIKLRDQLELLRRAAQAIDRGADQARLQTELALFANQIEETLAPLERRLAELLDRLHHAGRDADAEDDPQ